jgi:uncharacterized Zn finger protein
LLKLKILPLRIKKMRKIKGYVVCESTQRLLSRFKIFWGDAKTHQSQDFGSESEGFFELSVPQDLKQIVVMKENYQQILIQIHPSINAYIAKIRKL